MASQTDVASLGQMEQEREGDCGGPGYRLTEGIFFTLSLSGSRDVSAYRFAATRMSTLLQAMPNLSTTQPS